MKLFAFLIIIGLILGLAITGALAVMQASRFRYLNKLSHFATWIYIVISTLLALAIIIAFFTIDFA
ncbi:hypothetical protein HOM98_00015 [Candidatus Peregrinibacteria bacterium]|jgi:hypothetical protein|nr:hypothetical protein [Candidatus Peregrinibacteria bacterium]MBT7484591.1 hypothetical protein [Candidatus Peregrinibacteria bacterium]